MKKILALILALLLIIAMAVPAYAVTPELGVPDMPEIPDVSDDVEIELPDGIFDDYIPDIDIDVELPEEPAEPPEEEPELPSFYDCVKGWLEWWMGVIRCR